MTIDKVIAELRAAIEAGPTKGGWSGPRYVIYPTLYGDGWAPVHAQKRGEILRCKRVADAAYVAACSPDRIQRLLDALEATRADSDRYLIALGKIAAYRPMTFADCSDAEAVMTLAEEAIDSAKQP